MIQRIYHGDALRVLPTLPAGSPDEERRRPVTDMTSRYRAAWESARARARRYRAERDGYPSVTADGARAAEAFAARYTDRHVPPTDAALAVDHDTPLPYRTGDWVSRRGSQKIVRVTGVVYYGPLRGHIYTATGTRWGHGPAAPDEYELVHRDSTDTHGPTELQEGPDQ